MIHTVLIINGDPVQQDMLASFLQKRLGYRTAHLSSTREAIQYCAQNSLPRPDLVLLDSSAMNSVTDNEGIKQLCLYVPVVALVQYGDYEAAKSALASGAQDFLTKPVAMERISITFRNILLLRDAGREIERLRRELMQDTGHPDSAAFRSVHVQPLLTLLDEDRNIRSMSDIEHEAIRFAMQYYHGHMTEVARRLRIGRSTLYRKLGERNGKQQEAA